MGFSLPKSLKTFDFKDSEGPVFSLSESDEDEESWSWIFPEILSNKDSPLASSCSWCSAITESQINGSV